MKHTEWMTAISTNRTDYEFLKEIKGYSIDGIELSVNEWEVWKIDWSGLAENAKKAGITLLSYHLPFGEKNDISCIDAEIRKNAIAWQKELIEKATDIGIKRFIIHPSYEPIADEEREMRLNLSREGLKELAEYADERDAVICVEDLPRSCLGHTVDEMLYLVGSDERLRVCFDVNHLLTVYGCTHKDFVEALGDKIVTCHMSDYDFVDEKHFFCGNGDLNWDELIGLLEGIGYNGPFLYEGGFAPHRIMKDVPFGTFDKAHERQMNIRSFKGKQ